MEESFKLKVHAHDYLITSGFSEEDPLLSVFKVVYLDDQDGSESEKGEIAMNAEGKWVWVNGEWTQLSQDIGEAIESRDM